MMGFYGEAAVFVGNLRYPPQIVMRFERPRRRNVQEDLDAVRLQNTVTSKLFYQRSAKVIFL